MNGSTLALLRARHQHVVWARSVWIAVAGLLLELGLTRLGADGRVRWGVFGLVAVLAAIARFWPRRTLRDTARALDQAIGARNRFEAVAELGARGDAFASALRAEADAFLSQRPLPRAYAWFTSVALLIALSAANIATLRVGRTRPAVAPASAVATTDLAMPDGVKERGSSSTKPAAPPAAATLRWITPDSVITATSNEEIPLEAEAESTTGLRQVSLHIALNGEARPPFVIPETIAAGVQPVLSSLPLAGFETRPYDIVTYYLEAERIRPAGMPAETRWPTILSPVQLVQIRPLREERLAGLDGDDAAGRVLESIQQLQREQLAVVREAIALAHDAGTSADREWTERVRSAEARQTAVSQAAATAIPNVEPAGIPGDATQALTQGEKETRQAADGFRRGDPAAASASAGRALARFSAAEKSAAEVVRANRARRAAESAAAAMQGKKSEVAELPARETTVAGRLENLAAQQQKLAEKIGLRSAPNEVFSEEDRLARELVKLAVEPELPREISDAIKSAAEAARDAARQLNDQDALAATEPAARAAQTLKEATAALDSAGRARAVEEMLAAQQSFIRSATELQMAPSQDLAAAARQAAERTAAVQQNLQAAARGQQQKGSAEVAQKLDALAKAIAESGVQQALADVAKSASESNAAQQKQRVDAASQKLTELAQRSADAAGSVEGADKAGERARADLKRVEASLARASARGSHRLRWVTPNSDTTATASETVALQAEANSEGGFSKFELVVTVNGQPRPALALPAGVGAGVHAVNVSLELAGLKVKTDDIVSYRLVGEIIRPPAAASTPPAQTAASKPRPRSSGVTVDLGVLDGKPEVAVSDVVASGNRTVDAGFDFTPTQLITILSAKDKGSKGAVASKDDQNPRSFKARMLYLQSAQRAVVDGIFGVERGLPPRSDPSWNRVVRQIFTAEERNLAMTERLRDELQAALDALEALATSDAAPGAILDSIALEAPATAIFDLNDATDEMDAALRALNGPNPPAALPPATRALAALTRILNPNAQGDSSAAGPSQQKQGKGQPKSDPQQGQNTADAAKESSTPANESAAAPKESKVAAKEAVDAPKDPATKENPAVPLSAPELVELYEKTVASLQLTQSKALVEVPPPPGPGSSLTAQDEFVEVLAQRVSRLVQLSPAAPRDTKRTEVLRTGNPADAPPAYRPAVADYFEALARDRPAPAKPAP